MDYISNKNIKCKAVLYEGDIEKFVKQIITTFDFKFYVENFNSPISHIFSICIFSNDLKEMTSLHIKENHYLVQMEEHSIGIQGCVLIEKEIFEFLFREKEIKYDI